MSAVCLHGAMGFLDLRVVGTASRDVVTGEMGIKTVICVCIAEQSVTCREESKNSLVFISHILLHFNLLQHSACDQSQKWLWHPSWAEGGHLEAAIAVGWRCLTSYGLGTRLGFSLQLALRFAHPYPSRKSQKASVSSSI